MFPCWHQVAPVVGDMAAERRKNLDILATLAKKRAVLNTEKAANRHLAMEEKRWLKIAERKLYCKSHLVNSPLF